MKYFHANSTAPDSQATGADSVAIGGNAQATAANSVALGANSTTNANLGLAAFNPGTGTVAGATPAGEVSVGSAGVERRITNVAAGAAPTDAVNVSQLQAVSSQLNQVQNDALLWDPAANGGAGAFSAAHGGSGSNTITNVAAATLSPASTDAVNGSQLYATNQNVTNVTNAVNDIRNGGGIKYFHANSTAADSQAIGTDSVAIGPLAIASGTGSLAAGNGAQAQVANALALGAQSNVSVAGGVAIGSGSVSDRAVLSGVGSIAVGSHAIPFNTSDRALLGAVSFGDTSGNTYRQLTNVADGTQAQDAVTVRQLAGALSSFAVTGQKYFHANSLQADSLAVGVESVAVGPTTVVNGDNGIGMGNGAIVDATAPGGIAIGQSASSAQADAIALGSGSIAAGAQSIAQGANATALNAGGIAYGSGAHSSAIDAVALGAGASATFANSVALGAGSLTTVGALNNYIAYGLGSPQSSAGEVNVGNRQITGLAAGRVGSDAVNVSQLDAVASQLTTLINQRTTTTGGSFTSNLSGTNGAPAPSGTNASAGGMGAVASGANSTAVGNSSQAAGNGSTAIGVGATASGSNSVALGTGSNDGGRAGVLSVGSANSARQVANVAAGTEGNDAVNVNQLNAVSTALSTSVNNLGNQVNQMQQQIQQTDSMAREGIAATAAMASIPHMDRDSNFAMGIGTATFAGQKAMAVGMQARITENIKATLNGGFSGSQRVVGAGMLYQWK
ncbi:hemagluttinin domain protein [Burkholderia mayonis]|uniref:Hemagluttinin domain protein n=1 Tax=Burkholderia mayonis TaxID=1385591 RepID=A0A1B4FQ71_9BURK|nr:hemagluttinin domain protein [Burkholderia mayonis]KVE45800.1 hemagluttinin domain protein [Burkholderia mayonis]